MKMTRGFFALVIAASVPAVASADWAGPYIGVSLVNGSGEAEDITWGPGPFDIDGTGFGAFAGYNMQFGKVVVGAELDLSFGEVSGSDGAYQKPLSIDNSMALDVRAGADMGRALPYVTLGIVQGDYTSDHFGAGNTADFATGTLNGKSYGIGVDWMVNDSGFVRFEVLRTEYDASTFTYYGSDDHDMAKTSVTSVSIGYGLSF